MTPHHPRPDPRELLAAYADGELNAAEQLRVEAWLAEHPEYFADLEAQQAFGSTQPIWTEAAAPEPDDRAWASTLARVEARVLPPTACPVPATLAFGRGRPSGRVRSSPHRFRHGLLPLLAASAALLLVGLVEQPVELPSVPTDRIDIRVILPEADGIEIESVRDADHELLIVGRPTRPRMILATADDVVIDTLTPHGEAEPMVPMMDGDAPMVLAVARRPAPLER